MSRPTSRSTARALAVFVLVASSLAACGTTPVEPTVRGAVRADERATVRDSAHADSAHANSGGYTNPNV
jgi:hypothetical protein